MRTEQARSRGGKRYTGIHWKFWPTKEGERRQLYIAYQAEGKLRWERVPSNKITGEDGALRLRNTRLSDIAEGRYIDPVIGKTTVSELAERWYANELDCKPQTREKYRLNLDLHILPRLGSKQIKSVKIEDVEGFALALRDALGPTSCRQVVGQLKRILKAGVRWDYLRTNPADYAQVRFARRPPLEISPLTRDEARRFLVHIREHRPKWYPFFLTAISTGLRIGELFAMKWENLDEEAATYHVRETLTRSRRFDSTKTEGSHAKVPLSPAVLTALQEQRSRLAVDLLRKRDFPCPELVFPNSLGKPQSYHSVVFKVFKPLLEEIGIREIRSTIYDTQRLLS